MRLTCPNCAAQYEVPPEAIPPQGRDVQCSACGQTWFEQPADSRPQLMDAPKEGGRRVEDDPEEADDLAEIETAPAATAASVPPAAPAAAVPPTAAMTPAGEAAAAAERQRVPPEVERILREEAQHEARVRAEEAARRAAAASEPAPVPIIARPADAPPRSEVTEAATVATPVAPEPATVIRTIRPARHVDREIDLDRINSTLRSQADQIGAKAPRVEGAARRQRNAGFGGGFWGALLAVAILALIYVYRGQIIQAVPPAAAVLNPYAQAVETGRNWLDRQVARVLGADAAE